MWKRQALLARVLKLSLSKSSKTYQVFGTELLKSKSIFPLKWTSTIISHNFSTQSDSAKAFFELGKDNEAFSSIKKELSLNPQDQELHEILIDKLGEENRLQTDLESFYKTIVDMIADPKSVSNLYSTSAEALFDKKMFAQSTLAFRKALKNGPPMGLKLRYKFGQALLHEDNASNSAAYANYCLGKAGMANEEFEKIITYKSGTISTKMSDLLILCHLEDEKMIKHYKEHEFKGYFDLSEGEKQVQFYEQELEITQKILQKGDIAEPLREFNVRKLEALNILLPFLRKRMGREEEESKLPYW